MSAEKQVVKKQAKDDAYLFANLPFELRAEVEKLYPDLTCLSREQEKNIWGVPIEKCSSFHSPEEFLNNGKKTVVFCNNGWFVGGVERVLTNLLPKLNQRYNMIMLSLTDDPSNGFHPGDGIFFAPMSHHHEIPLYMRVALFARTYHCDVFVGHANISEPFFESYRLLKELGIKTIMMNHYGYFMPYNISWLLPVAVHRNIAFEYADIILWLKTFDVNAMATNKENLGVMPNPNQYPSQKKHDMPQSPIILAVGRFDDANKRLDRVFDIFHSILKQLPESKLIVVGNYDPQMVIPERGKTQEECYREYRFNHGQVSFVGQRKAPSEYYQQASICLMTSNHEGLSMVMVEALSFGVPVVAVQHKGINELIQDGYNGYVAETCEDAAGKACQLLTDQTLYQAISEQAIESSKRYDADVVSKKWELLIEGLTDPRKLSSHEILEQAGLLPDSSYKDTSSEEIIKEQKKLLETWATTEAGRAEQIRVMQTDLVQTQDALQAATTNLTQANAALQNSNVTFEKTQERLVNTAATLGYTQEQLQARTIDLEQVREALRIKTVDLEQVREALRIKTVDLERMQEQLQAMQKMSVELKELLREKSSDLVQSRKHLQTCASDLEQTKKKLQNKSSDLDWAQELLQNREADLKRVREQLQSTTSDLDATRKELRHTHLSQEKLQEKMAKTASELEQTRVDLWEATASLECSNEALEQANNRVDAMQQTLSWRITAPLRVIGKKVKRNA